MSFSAHGKKFVILLEKVSQNKLNDDKVSEQLTYIKHAVSRNKQAKLRGSVRNVHGPEDIGKEYRYSAELIIKKVGETRTEERLIDQFDNCRKVVATAASSQGWHLTGETIHSKSADTLVEAKNAQMVNWQQNLDLKVPELTDEASKQYLGRLFERESQIHIIHHSVLTASRTRMEKRRHGVLYGPAGCAKSELLSSLKEFYGGDKAVLELDATTCTKAGLERLILKLAGEGVLPPILFIEEIEKQNQDTLHCMLQIMDSRGRIERTLAFAGKNSQQAKVLVWGTCNNEKILQGFMHGALWSRFCHRVYCPRPTRELMAKILLREIKEMDGKEEWIQPALKFCFDELKTNDPRVACALLDGGDDLLSGKYLAYWREVLDKKEQDIPTEAPVSP